MASNENSASRHYIVITVTSVTSYTVGTILQPEEFGVVEVSEHTGIPVDDIRSFRIDSHEEPTRYGRNTDT